MSNPITCLTKKEWAVWLGALLIIVVSNIFSANIEDGFIRTKESSSYFVMGKQCEWFIKYDLFLQENR